MFKRILAIGAHPDDVELGCAGTLLKYQKQVFREKNSDLKIVLCLNL